MANEWILKEIILGENFVGMMHNFRIKFIISIEYLLPMIEYD